MTDAPADPVAWLREDRRLASLEQDPCASLCAVANVDEEGLPQVRTLVLRDLEDALAVFVNATSPKWRSLGAGPVGVLVWLPSRSVQYRMHCRTAPVPADVIADRWQLRPDVPKRMDWLYTRLQPQGSAVESRASLLELLASVELPEPLEAPDTARGLFLLPDRIERLDVGRPDGVHDRRRFERGNPGWSETVLVP